MSWASIAEAPAFKQDRGPLASRTTLDFIGYGFEVMSSVNGTFEVVPSRLDADEMFLFFFAREDVVAGRWALFNLHMFPKRHEALEPFARSLGESVKTVALASTTAFGKPAIGYARNIAMRDLFKGGEPVIGFIGGEPDRVVADSHLYFKARDACCYTGMLHPPGEDARYQALREKLFKGIRFFG